MAVYKNLELKVEVKKFSELDIYELYEILRLREEIFIVEQECPYQDCDRKDFNSLHMLIKHNEKLVAYTRLIPRGISYSDSSIGRVVVRIEYRKYGLGYFLMRESIKALRENFDNPVIRISAQHHLMNFYSKLGFKAVGEVYLEDDIPHIEMYLPADAPVEERPEELIDKEHKK